MENAGDWFTTKLVFKTLFNRWESSYFFFTTNILFAFTFLLIYDYSTENYYNIQNILIK